MLPALVAAAAHVGDVGDHVDRIRIAAGGRVEKGDVAGGRDDRDRRTGGIAGQDSGLLDIALAGAGGKAHGEQESDGRFGGEQTQGEIPEDSGDAS